MIYLLCLLSYERGKTAELNDTKHSIDYNTIQGWKASQSELNPQEEMVSRKKSLFTGRNPEQNQAHPVDIGRRRRKVFCRYSSCSIQISICNICLLRSRNPNIGL